MILSILAFLAAACAPVPVPAIGNPVTLATPIRTPIPAEKLPVVAIQTFTPSPVPLPTTRISTLQAHGGRVSWLRSRNVLAFDETGKDGYADVYTANPDGSNKVCLTCGKKDLPQKHNGNPDWSPNGNYIVFQSEEPDFKLKGLALGELMASPASGINNNIWVMTADGTHFWRITHINPMEGVLHPHFSPDGKKLVWSQMILSQAGIGQWVIKMADFSIIKNQPGVSNVIILLPLSMQWYETHDFSPDQSRIIFSALPQGKGFFESEIYTYNLLSQVTERLTVNQEWDEYAQYSPDGKWIAWVSSSGIDQPHPAEINIQQPPKTDVWLMHPDGTGKQRLTRFNDPAALEGSHAPVGVTCGDISWGPDSRSFALRIQIGHDQSIIRVEFDSKSLAP